MRLSQRIPREMMPRDGGPGPTRRIESRNPNRVIRLFPSTYMGCMVPCESLGEFEQVTQMEADGSVIRFRVQPDVVTWNDDGVIRRHTPDLEVRFDDGRTELQEVKPFALLSAAKLEFYQRRTKILREDLSSRSIGYELVDSTSIQFRQRYLAAGQVISADPARVGAGLTVLVREAILLTGANTFGDLHRLVPAATIADLRALALRRELVIDLNLGPISGQTGVRLPNHTGKESKR